MGWRWRTGLASAIVVAVTAGCGGHTGMSGRSQSAAEDSGKTVFAQACASCHTLTGRYDPRRQGGDLLAFDSSRAQMLELAGEMPVRHPLSRRRLNAVVRYVMAVESASG
jgi:mono/diheme cytochrome c family protein